MFFLTFNEWIKWTDIVSPQTDKIWIYALTQCINSAIQLSLEEDGVFER